MRSGARARSQGRSRAGTHEARGPLAVCAVAFACAVALHDRPVAAAPGYVHALTVGPLLVRGTGAANDYALQAAGARAARMLARAPEILENMKRDGVEIHVFGVGEPITNLPELVLHRADTAGEQTWDARYRGGEAFGRFVECGAENMVHAPSDPYPAGYDVCSHEIAHLVFSSGLDGALREAVETRYRAALAEGLWRGTYPGSRVDEFFADLSMRYFDLSGDTRPRPKDLYLGRTAFQLYDPSSFALLDAIYTGQRAPQAVTRLRLKPLAVKAAIAARSTPSGVPAPILIENASSGRLRLARLDPDGHVHPWPRPIPPGGLDGALDTAGGVITVLDEATRTRVATVVLPRESSILHVDDAMVDAMVEAAASHPGLHVDVPLQL